MSTLAIAAVSLYGKNAHKDFSEKRDPKLFLLRITSKKLKEEIPNDTKTKYKVPVWIARCTIKVIPHK